MRYAALVVVSLLSSAGLVYAGFTPSAICIDPLGQTIPGPESTDGFNFGNVYKFFPVPAPPSKASPTTGISYSSAYLSQDFSVIEESLDNFNQIGDRYGTHWVTCELQRNITYRTITASTSVPKVKASWPSFAGLPSLTVEYKTYTTSVQIPTGSNFSFVWKSRESVADVHVFDPATGTDGKVTRTPLSDNPSLKKIINVIASGTSYTSDNCLASAYVLIGKGDSDPWNKPVIVSDGLDPRGRISIQEIMENVENSLTPNAFSFVKTLTDKGYDVVFVDYGSGGKEIVSNTRALLRVIEEVCARCNGRVMVGGYSMGGVLARVALLLGEKNNLGCMNKISRYLSIDSPHLGAQINYDMQEKVFAISNTVMSDPRSYLAYEKVAAVAYDLNCTAARQLLFNHASSGTAEHNAFFNFIQSLGNYPSRVKLYAVGDAAWKWPYPGINYATGAKAAEVMGTNLYVRDDDLFPGAYIDLWASGDAADGNQVPISGLGGFGALSTIAAAAPILSEYFQLQTCVPSSSRYNDTRFKPTFIPLYSALGIDKAAFLQISEPQNQVDLDRIAAVNSPFDKLYLVNFASRPKHIEFDGDMADKVLKVVRPVDISAVLQLLLD